MLKRHQKSTIQRPFFFPLHIVGWPAHWWHRIVWFHHRVSIPAPTRTYSAEHPNIKRTVNDAACSARREYIEIGRGGESGHEPRAARRHASHIYVRSPFTWHRFNAKFLISPLLVLLSNVGLSANRNPCILSENIRVVQRGDHPYIVRIKGEVNNARFTNGWKIKPLFIKVIGKMQLQAARVIRMEDILFS